MRVRYLGHSAVEIQGSKTIYIDPFLSGNPVAAVKPEAIRSADLVLVTHDHEDHLGDAAPIAKQTGATLVATHEIAVRLEQEAGIKAEGMNMGGTLSFGKAKVHMVHALHTAYATHPVGFVLELDGKTIYHLGDTALFGDMRLYAEFWRFDLAFVPIGDRYTMGPVSAAKAVEFLRPKKVVPIHYNTFPLIEQDPKRFADLVGRTAETVILAPGESLEL